MKIFGFPAYAHVDNGKLEPRSLKCIFLDFKLGIKGYRLWFPETNNVIISRDIIFDESAMLHDSPSRDVSNKQQQSSITQVELHIDS